MDESFVRPDSCMNGIIEIPKGCHDYKIQQAKEHRTPKG